MGATVRLDLDGDATDLQRAAGQAGDALDDLQTGITGKTAAFAAAGAGLAVGLASAFTASLDMADAQAKFAAQLGGSSEYAADMGAIAGKLYANAYGENLGEVNEALRQVLQVGLLSEDAADADIERVTGKVMSLASAFDQDVGGAVNAVSQMIKTGLAGDADQAMDMLVRGFQQGNDKAGDLLDTMNEYGTQFRKLGMDGTEAMGLIRQGLQGGARDADLVADAVKEFSIRSIDGSKGAADSYAALGLSASQMTAQIAAGGDGAKQGLDTVLDRLAAMKDPAAQSAAAVGLFGTQAEDLGQALYGLDLTTAAEGMGNVAGAADKVDKALGETAAAKLESVKRGFQEWTNSIVGVQGPLGTVAASVMTFGGDAIGIAGSVGMAAMAISQLGLVSKIAAGGQWLLNVALSANPIGIVVLAIAALVAGLIWAYNNVDWFREGVDAAFSFVVDVIGGAVDWIAGAWGDLVSFFTEAPGQIGGVVESVGEWFANLPTMIGEGLAALGEMILTFFTDTLPNGIAFALGYLAGLVYNGAVATWDFLWNTLPAAIGQAIEWLGTLPGLALDALINLSVYLVQVATDAWAWFMEASSTGAQITLDWIATLPGIIGEWLASLPGIIGNAAVLAWDWFLNATTTGGQNALNWVSEIPGKIGGFFANAGSWLVDAGRMIIEGLWNGLKSVAQGVLDWISNIGAQIAAGFNAAVGVKSPSVIFADSGRNMMRGVLVGYEDLGPNVIAEAASLGRQTTEAYTTSAMIRTEDGGMVPPSFYSQTSPAYQAKYGAPQQAAGEAATVTFAGNTDTAFASAFMKLYREGKIQIKVGV